MSLTKPARTPHATTTRAPRRPDPHGDHSLGTRLRRNKWVYAFLLPTIVLYGMYTLWPIAASVWYSLLDWDGLTGDGEFVGGANYAEAFSDPFFWNALWITLLFMLVSVPVRVGLALGAAIVLNNPRLPFARLFRTALFLPVVTTTAIVGIVLGFVLDPVGGPVNHVLLSLGLVDTPVNFLGDAGLAPWTAMGVHVWKWFGITLVYWLAALQTVPRELLEAAEVDGAGPWQRFRHVTLPVLKPFLVIITLLSAVETLQVFDLVLTLTNGGPFFSTEVVEVYLYRLAYASTTPRLGYASAVAVLFGAVTVVLAALQVLGVRLARRNGRKEE
ncbi:sugar ABC transporter permease [Streptomyces sp. NBC_01808]|uniref:carbohydrate ABC transporter permease n=1 Tax=Streptomyces sp. NBC_01808 TaxID=2975947 RepID=UPI002DDB1AE3|nr:sugar ABC transporter permease [Streptomyces sp. NBC_01808]WSA40251.1 sugar ABC transporter permease [Streptomyces sp. NBC_01808]